MNTNKNSMIVQLNESQFDSLKFYTGVKADKYIATREEAIEYLSMFMSEEELSSLQCKECYYLVIFELQSLNNDMAQKV